MSDELEQRFLEAIANNPDDEEARAVYADWLEERGDPRGEYLRLELQLFNIPLRIDELARSIDGSWLDAVSRIWDLQLGDPGRNKIGTIKEVRAITGLGLKDSKDIVDRATNDKPVTLRKRVSRAEADALAAQLAPTGATFQIVGHAGQRAIPARRGRVTPSLTLVLTSVVAERKLDAIKLVRESGHGLVVAKELVERVQAGGREPVERGLSTSRATELATRFAGIGGVVVEPE